MYLFPSSRGKYLCCQKSLSLSMERYGTYFEMTDRPFMEAELLQDEKKSQQAKLRCKQAEQELLTAPINIQNIVFAVLADVL